MVKADISLLKKLREETQVSIADCRKALEESNNDYQKALSWLKKHGIEKAEKKESRQTSQGLIESYVHQSGRIGVLLEILCETDFVARTQEFKNLAHELCLQIASMTPKNVEELLKQEYIRDPQIKVGDLVKQAIGKIGENIIVQRFERFELGV